jgi:hypothetical protein
MNTCSNFCISNDKKSTKISRLVARSNFITDCKETIMKSAIIHAIYRQTTLKKASETINT